MHMWSNEHGLWGGNAIVAAQMPIAVGVAFASHYRGEDTIAACYFGDGAVDEGAFHESLNLAAVWHLPVIFYCENNQYAVTTAFSTASAVPNVADRAAAYSMPGIVVDGQDLSKMSDRARTAYRCQDMGFVFQAFNLLPVLYRVRQAPEGAEALRACVRLADYLDRHALRPA